MTTNSNPQPKNLFCLSFLIVLFFHFFYVLSFPLNFGGDASVYYTMIATKQSSLLMAAGYPFLFMLPYHWMRGLISKVGTIPEDPFFTPWWQSSSLRMDLIGAKPIDVDFSWMAAFQDHGFIIFQHSIAILSVYCGFVLARRYFGYRAAIVFMLLYGISPMSLQWPSCTLPEWLQGSFLVFWLYFADLAKRSPFPQKAILHGSLGILGVFLVLIKFNSLPLLILLYAGLLYVEKDSYLKTLSKFILSTGVAACVLLAFISFYHFPSTGSRSLSMNSWPLMEKVFKILPSPSLPASMGVSSKRLLAICNLLPNDEEQVWSPAKYFRSLNAVDGRQPYQEKLSWLGEASDEKLNAYLLRNPPAPIFNHGPALKVAYFLGLGEYSAILNGIYKESIINYPFSFIRETFHCFFNDFAMRENSYRFHPLSYEVQAGSDLTQKSKYGFVRFRWPEERYLCYHENIAWQPGVWFFTNWEKFWLPTWCFWLLTFIAAAMAVKNIQVQLERSILIMFLFCGLLAFIWVSNAVFEFRLKEYEVIRGLSSLLAAVGLLQAIGIFRCFLRNGYFRWKIKSINHGLTNEI